MQLHQVDPDTCRGDGICADVCPSDIIEMVEGKAATIESRAGSCIKCGQCVAVCPTESLSMPGFSAGEFEELPDLPFGFEDFHDFLRRRRSVRIFKNRPVASDLIDKILAAATTAPMGLPPHSTGVVVINQREELDYLLSELVKDYEVMIKTFSNPLGRAFIRIAAGAEDFHSLKSHIVDVAKMANELYHRDGTDRYMYHVPTLMLFHGDRRALSHAENAHIVCHSAMLAAISLGLGTTIIGVVPPIVDRSKSLRARYGIPRDNKVLTSLIAGHPRYRYKRSIRRDLAGTRLM